MPVLDRLIRKKEASIVLVGDFNPTIFQPLWFSSQGLLAEQFVQDSQIEIIRPELVAFKIEWLKVQVTRERFQISTLQEPFFEPLRDLAEGTFELLSHTPIKFLGINNFRQYQLPSIDKWHALGDLLAPKDVWRQTLEEPGLLSMTIKGQRPDAYIGAINVKVESTNEIERGIEFNINDHYDFSSEKPSKAVHGAAEVIEALKNSWVDSIARADKIVEELLGNVL